MNKKILVYVLKVTLRNSVCSSTLNSQQRARKLLPEEGITTTAPSSRHTAAFLCPGVRDSRVSPVTGAFSKVKLPNNCADS